MSAQLTLLDVEPCGLSEACQRSAFKRQHGILTHRSRSLVKGEKPWTALLPVEADKGKGLVEIMSESCRLYDEGGRVGYGEGELSAIRELCAKMAIECPL